MNVFIDKDMLKHMSSSQVDAFYNCVSTLISNQVLERVSLYSSNFDLSFSYEFREN